MEPKQAPAQSVGMMHGVITSTAMYLGHHHKRYTEFVAKLDNNMMIVLHQSHGLSQAEPYHSSIFDAPSSVYRRRPGPAPLDIGSHVMAGTDPAYCEKDGRVPYPVARMWRRAKAEEIPGNAVIPRLPADPLAEPLI